MSKIQITAEIDATDLMQVEAAASFLKAVGGHLGKPQEPVKKEPVLKKVIEHKETPPETQESENKTSPEVSNDYSEWTAAQMKQMDTEDLKDACADIGIDFEAVEGMNTNAKLRKLILQHFSGPKTEPDTKMQTESKPSSGATIDDVRKAIGAKIENNKDEIKKKITELGAKNVSGLAEDKYQEFLDFLNSL